MRPLPAGSLVLVLALATAPAPEAGDVPTVDDLVALHLAAQGGLARLDAVGSLRATGSFELSDAAAARFVQERKRPGAVRLELAAQDEPVTVLATDGTSAWEIRLGASPEVEALPAAQTARYARQIAIDGPLVLAHRRGRPLELVGEEQIDGRAAWKLGVVWEDGERSDLFLDRATHLVVRMDDYWRIGPDEIRIEIHFGDYREVAGVPFPYRVEQITSQGSWRFAVDDLEANVPIADERFRPPASGA